MEAYAQDHGLAQQAGAAGVQLRIAWSELEPTQGVFDHGRFSSDPALTTGLARNEDTLFTFGVLDGGKTVPAEMLSVPFDHPVMMASLRAALDQLLPHLHANAHYLSLGHNVDLVLQNNNQWPAFSALVADAAAHVHQVRPDMKVGVTTTWAGATQTHVNAVGSMNLPLDVSIHTYSVFGHGNEGVGPSQVPMDLAVLMAVAGGRPVVLQEVRYPASVVVGGSEQQQAQAIDQLFAFRRSVGWTVMPFVGLFKLRDWPAAHCQTWSMQQPGQRGFERLCSLGLRNADGTPKPAWNTLVYQLSNP